jgi:hypothetical protein
MLPGINTVSVTVKTEPHATINLILCFIWDERRAVQVPARKHVKGKGQPDDLYRFDSARRLKSGHRVEITNGTHDLEASATPPDESHKLCSVSAPRP